jgi:hypothetical protein
MHAPLNSKLSILGSLALLVLLGCRANQPTTSAQTKNAQPTHVFTPAHLVQVEVRVVDSATALPVAGATVIPFCMGGTPYATNSYRTDSKGRARVVSYDSIAFVNVTMDGYELAGATFSPADGVTNAEVRLKRRL